jgi:hypothetical protein
MHTVNTKIVIVMWRQKKIFYTYTVDVLRRQKKKSSTYTVNLKIEKVAIIMWWQSEPSVNPAVLLMWGVIMFVLSHVHPVSISDKNNQTDTIKTNIV